MDETFMNERGQIMSYDLILAGFIFLMIIVGTMSIYNTQKIRYEEQFSFAQMQISGINALNTIISDQNCYNGGLANEKGNLSATKIICFSSQDYNTLKEKLAIENYEFYLKIYDNNTTNLEKGITTTKRAIALQRVVQMGTTAKKINFIIYEQ
jgi:hypothetical protein